MFNFALLFRNYGILLVTILLFVILAVTADGFATERNLRNILDQQSMVIIAASFMTIAIISGNFDVSVSAIFVTAPLFGLRVENLTGNVFLAVATALAVGLLMGAINGFIVTRLKINSFIGTLATSFMFFWCWLLGFKPVADAARERCLSPDCSVALFGTDVRNVDRDRRCHCRDDPAQPHAVWSQCLCGRRQYGSSAFGGGRCEPCTDDGLFAVGRRCGAGGGP